MRTLIFLIRAVIYSNLFVSICITLLTHQTYILLQLPDQDKYYLLTFVFCSTYFTYNFQRILRLKLRELLGKQIGIRLSWVVRNRKVLLFSAILALFISFMMIFFMSKNFILFSIPLSALSTLYVVPFFRFKGKKVALRNLPYLKVFIIAVVWAFVIVGLPYFNHHKGLLLNSNAGWLFLSQFLFIMAITLPFDVRDLNYDLATQIKTFPSKIGIRGTILFSEILLLGFMAVKYYQFHLGHLQRIQFISLVVATIISGTIIAFTARKRSELFYSGLVEGTMMIMYVSILLLEY